MREIILKLSGPLVGLSKWQRQSGASRELRASGISIISHSLWRKRANNLGALGWKPVPVLCGGNTSGTMKALLKVIVCACVCVCVCVCVYAVKHTNLAFHIGEVFFKSIYFFWGDEGQRERIPGRLRVVSPETYSGFMNCETMTWAETKNRMLNWPGAPQIDEFQHM